MRNTFFFCKIVFCVVTFLFVDNRKRFILKTVEIDM